MTAERDDRLLADEIARWLLEAQRVRDGRPSDRELRAVDRARRWESCRISDALAERERRRAILAGQARRAAR